MIISVGGAERRQILNPSILLLQVVKNELPDLEKVFGRAAG
jgi:hypothetical protein